MFYIAQFTANPRYSGDSYILGIFSSEALAEAAVEAAMDSDRNSYQGYPARYEQKRHAYSVTLMEVNVVQSH